MHVQLNPYLNFRENTRQAMEFYHTVFGGNLNMQTYRDFHLSQDPSEDNLILHALLEGENGIKIMAADVPMRMEYRPGTNFSVSLSGDDADLLTSYFEKLSEGGKVTMPLMKAAWGDTFGMCTDKFGTNWMVDITAPQTQS